jgi:hypothetical protein
MPTDMKTRILLTVLTGLLFLTLQSFSQTQNCLDFDGINDYVLVPGSSSLDVSSAYTIEAWFYRRSGNNTYKPIFFRGQGGGTSDIEIYTQNSTFNFWLTVVHNRGGNFGYAYWPTIPADQWIHIAVRFTGTLVNVYYNGIYQAPVQQNEAFPVPAASLQNVRLGWYFYSGVYHYHYGNIDDLRIWNTALTVDQIRNNMYRELQGYGSLSNLMAYYQFNQTGGTLLPDLTANGNNGTLTNMDPSTDWVVSTAPIPYYTLVAGNWNVSGTWAAGQLAPVNAWARIKVLHAVAVNTAEDAEELLVNTGASVTINPGASLTVYTSLTNNAGSSGLVVEANASAMGSLLHNTAGIQGTVKEYLTQDRWHFVSSPISGALSGVYTNIYLIKYIETNNTWPYIIPTNVPLQVTRGYGAYSSSSLGSPTTVTYTGVLNNGNYTIPVSFTLGQGNGWNLVGNPYSSALKWNANWTTNNLDATAYFYNGAQYLTWNRLTGVGTAPSGNIPVSQGFFVKANATGAYLTFPQNERTNSTQAFYKEGEQASPVIKLLAEGNGYGDATLIYFNENATTGFDNNYDAYKLSGIPEAPKFYSIIEPEILAVNALPYPANDKTIRMGFEIGASGLYKIKLGNENPGQFYEAVYLEDLKENILINLVNNTEYSFFANITDDAERFLVHLFKPAGQNDFNPDGITAGENIYASGKAIYVNLEETSGTRVRVYDILGREVHNIAQPFNVNRIEMEQPGCYIVEVVKPSGIETKKVTVN